MRDLPALPTEALLCTVDVVGLYPNIQHYDGLAALKKTLDRRTDKSVSTESLLELAECVLKNNIFEHDALFLSNSRAQLLARSLSNDYEKDNGIVFMYQKLQNDGKRILVL